MKRLILAVTMAVMLAGCGESEAAKPAAKASPPKSDKMFEQKTTNDVLVTVNGVSLTKGALELQITVQEEIAKIANPRVSVSDLMRQRNKTLRNAEKSFIDRHVMLGEAKRRGITLTSAERAAIRERFAKSVLKGRGKYGLVAGKLDEASRAELDGGLDSDALVQKVAAAIREEVRVTVTDAQVQKKFKDIEAYNAGARAEEAKIWKTASNTWQRIRSGEDFAEAGQRLAAQNEHITSDMEWGDFELDFFKDDPTVCRYLTVMPEGMVTPPCTGDNGLLIVKILKKIPVQFDQGITKPRYSLAKIFFELPEYYPLGTVEELRKEMDSVLTEEAFKARVAELVKGATIEYPNGKVRQGPKCIEIDKDNHR